MYRATKNLFAVKTALTRNRHGRGIGRGRQVVERMVSAEGIEPSAHKDRRRCSQWVEGSIPSALTILSTTWRPRPIPRPCLFRVSAVFTANRFLVARYISVPNP